MTTDNTEITLTLPSRDQAKVVMAALELYARLTNGQLEELDSMARFGTLAVGPNGHPGRDLDAYDAVAAAMRHAKVAMGYPVHGGRSIVSEEAPLHSRRAWETFKVLSQALGTGCGQEGLTVRCTQDTPPSAQVSVPA